VIGNEVCGTGYYVASNYNLSNPQIEIVNYYDNYDFLEGSFFTDSVSSTNLQGTCQGLTASLKTGDITATSDGHFLARTFYYDAKAHIIDQRETTLDGSTIRTSTTYSFTGKPLTVQTTLDANSCTFVIDESYAYNVLTNQLLSHDIEYEDSTVRVGSYSYNQLGRLATEFKSDSRIGQTYSYNLHGWLTGITATKLYNGYSDFFSQHLYYESGCGTPCYNGNISAMKWKTLQQPYGNGYRFSYDKRNRLTEATYSNYSDLSILPYVYSETMTYNRNSAITTLVRTGNSQAGYGNMDFLQYAYVGNKLKSINDMGSSNVYDGAFEFVDGSSNTQEYWYNTAGDLTRDANKGIALINYDLLGHPIRVQFTNGNVTQYVYAADGRKLRTKQTTAVEGLTVAMGHTLELTAAQIMDVDFTDYAGNLQITRGLIGSNPNVPSVDYHFGDGYLSITAKPYRPYPGAVVGVRYVDSYHYYLRDHLGSNRMVVSGDGAVEQANEYYPYGGPWGDVCTNQGLQPYKYNCKELDRVHGLDWYDYGARRYDPAFCQFTQMDPLCEQYPHLSPYAYCAGNPVNCIDSEGKKIVFVNGLSRYYWGLANYLVPGKDYWHPTTVDKAKETLNDQNVVFEAIEHIITSSANQRRNRGYRYARRHFSRLAEGLKEGESIKFVTHSMGAAFAEGMADYLREQGLTVDYMLHFSPYQAADIEAKNSSDVLTIDIQTKEDFVLNYRINSKGSIKNAKTVKLPQQGIGNSHTESMTNDLYWREIMRIINEYLYNEQND
jgi:RHS repeat-associated protein